MRQGHGCEMGVGGRGGGSVGGRGLWGVDERGRHGHGPSSRASSGARCWVYCWLIVLIVKDGQVRAVVR